MDAPGPAHLAHSGVHRRPPREVDPVVHEVLDAVTFDRLEQQADGVTRSVRFQTDSRTSRAAVPAQTSISRGRHLAPSIRASVLSGHRSLIFTREHLASLILFDEILTCDEWQFKPAGWRLSEAGSPHLSRPDNFRGLDFFQVPPKRH